MATETEAIGLVVIILLLSYILIQGRKGFFFFKQKFPFWKNKAMWYVIRRKSGSYKIDYALYKPQLKFSKDGIPTNITKIHNRESDTGEPVIFIEEGKPQNIDPNDNQTPQEMDKWFNQMFVAAHLQGVIDGVSSVTKKKNFDLLFAIGFIMMIAGMLFIGFQMSEMKELLVAFKTDYETYKPFIENAIADLNRTGGSGIR